MKLNRRDFLRATWLAGVLTALGIELPEAVEKSTAAVPPVGQIKIQYNKGGGWTSLDEPPSLRPEHCWRMSNQSTPPGSGFLVHPDFRDELAAYAKSLRAEMLTESP